MKKILSMVLALTMVFALCAPAMAEGSTINSDNYTDGQSIQNADVELSVSCRENVQDIGGEVDPQKNDTQNRVWNVTISARDLHWNLVENVQNYGQNWALRWDVNLHKYVKEYEVGTEHQFDNIALAANDTANKTFTITNNSNFDVTQETSISANPDLLESPFEITAGRNSTIQTGSYTDVTVTLDTNKLNLFKGVNGFSANVENFTAGTARVSMQAGNIYTGAYYMQNQEP